MFSSVRYLATVRRAMTMPFPAAFLRLLIGKRAGGIFLLEDFSDHILHAGIGKTVAGGGLNAGGEEYSSEQPCGFDVFARDGAADRGFVNADDLGDLDHGERLQESTPLSMNSRWRRTISRAMFKMVCCRWCRLLMRNLPARISRECNCGPRPNSPVAPIRSL